MRKLILKTNLSKQKLYLELNVNSNISSVMPKSICKIPGMPKSICKIPGMPDVIIEYQFYHFDKLCSNASFRL